VDHDELLQMIVNGRVSDSLPSLQSHAWLSARAGFGERLAFGAEWYRLWPLHQRLKSLDRQSPFGGPYLRSRRMSHVGALHDLRGPITTKLGLRRQP
jgi:hypothetical protein